MNDQLLYLPSIFLSIKTISNIYVKLEINQMLWSILPQLKYDSMNSKVANIMTTGGKI